ncbi:hypothetical protein LA080_002509 [Diaporthe eres]|uniref:FAD-binding PCMH-type domain-containing protein n=1 Tax=Diaporthe vaccinii TaxID=105482 RepID=A0ABR4E2J7_9PEZI|nr:hypothetical protein LA080_002509 [Diaporthe eres]
MTCRTSFTGMVPRCLWTLGLLCFIHSFPQLAHGQEQDAYRVAPRASVVDCLTSKKLSVIKPSDTNYASYSSPYNLRLQYKPAAIVVASTNQHVSDAVLCASQYKLKVQPRSGGHSYGSYGTGGKDGAVVKTYKSFRPLGNLELALQPTGRALPLGTCANVGAGGHFTIGGDGFTTRAYGLAIDSLLGMDIVLANGSLVHATSTEYKDVFFAMKGAGASFGIATTFYAQTFAYPKALTGIYLTWPGLSNNTEQSVSALKHIQNHANNATSGPDRKFQFDVTLDAFGTFSLKGIYLGPVATFNRTVLPELLRGLPAPGAGDSDSPTYVKEYSWADALADANYGGDIAYPNPGEGGYAPAPDHDTFYTKSITVPAPGLPDKAIRNLVGWGQAHQQDKKPADAVVLHAEPPGRRRQPDLPGGQERRVGVLAPRHHLGHGELGVTGVLGAGNYGAYQGYVDTELSADQAGWIYYGDLLFEKLKGLKKNIDPGNLFSSPQSIPVGN